MNDIAAQFGTNLARRRKRAHLSQEELAVRASLHRTAIGQLERGERTARIDTLVKLAGSLDLPPGELLDGMGCGLRAGRESVSSRRRTSRTRQPLFGGRGWPWARAVLPRRRDRPQDRPGALAPEKRLLSCYAAVR